MHCEFPIELVIAREVWWRASGVDIQVILDPEVGIDCMRVVGHAVAGALLTAHARAKRAGRGAGAGRIAPLGMRCSG